MLASASSRSRTGRSAPWDVPVELVVVPPTALVSADRVSVHRVGVGLDVPGVRALEVHVEHADGRGHITRIAACSEGADGELALLLAELAGAGTAVPVRMTGSEFVHDTLRALCDLPAGARCTYAELAATSGRPRAVRAVASVLARNCVPLLVPCHRVVPATGGVGGYLWGSAAKAAVLAAEHPSAGNGASA